METMQLSIEERNRRYKLIREAMERQGLDCLIIYGDSGKWDSRMGHIRYISQVGGNGEEGIALFPREGDPTLILWIGRGAHRQEWLDSQAWMTDLRGKDPDYAGTVKKRIKELKLQDGSFGVVGLTGVDISGSAPYPIHKEIVEEFPQARFENTTDILIKARAIKSAEEIKFLEKAAQIGDAAIETMKEVVKAGVKESEVYARMVYTMLAHGSENPIMFLWDSGAPVRAIRLTFAQGRALKKGDVIVTEFSPRYCGYYSHFQQPAAVGEIPKDYGEFFKVALEAYHTGLEALKPGITVKEWYDACHRPLKKAGYIWEGPHFHGMGLSWEAPTGRPPFPPGQESMVIEEGMHFGYEPGVATPDGGKGLHLGDPILVTAKGAHKLSKFKPEFIIGR